MSNLSSKEFEVERTYKSTVSGVRVKINYVLENKLKAVGKNLDTGEEYFVENQNGYWIPVPTPVTHYINLAQYADAPETSRIFTTGPNTDAGYKMLGRIKVILEEDRITGVELV